MLSSLSIWVKLLLYYISTLTGTYLLWFFQFWLWLVALILSLGKLQAGKYVPVLFIVVLAFTPGVKRRDFFY